MRTDCVVEGIVDDMVVDIGEGEVEVVVEADSKSWRMQAEAEGRRSC